MSSECFCAFGDAYSFWMSSGMLAGFYPVLLPCHLLCNWLFCRTCRNGQLNNYRLVGEVADYTLSCSFNLEQVAVHNTVQKCRVWWVAREGGAAVWIGSFLDCEVIPRIRYCSKCWTFFGSTKNWFLTYHCCSILKASWGSCETVFGNVYLMRIVHTVVCCSHSRVHLWVYLQPGFRAVG